MYALITFVLFSPSKFVLGNLETFKGLPCRSSKLRFGSDTPDVYSVYLTVSLQSIQRVVKKLNQCNPESFLDGLCKVTLVFLIYMVFTF